MRQCEVFQSSRSTSRRKLARCSSALLVFDVSDMLASRLLGHIWPHFPRMLWRGKGARVPLGWRIRRCFVGLFLWNQKKNTLPKNKYCCVPPECPATRTTNITTRSGYPVFLRSSPLFFTAGAWSVDWGLVCFVV